MVNVLDNPEGYDPKGNFCISVEYKRRCRPCKNLKTTECLETKFFDQEELGTLEWYEFSVGSFEGSSLSGNGTILYLYAEHRGTDITGLANQFMELTVDRAF